MNGKLPLVLVAVGVLACQTQEPVTPPTPTPTLTPRPIPPKAWLLGPLLGTGCPDFGCAEGHETTAQTVLAQLDQFEAFDIPLTGYHFDGYGWALPEKRCSWTAGDALLTRLREKRIPALLHYWGGCDTVEDFDRVHAQLGDTLGGFYLDWGAADDFSRLTTEWVRTHLPKRGEVVLKAFAPVPGYTPTDETLQEIGHTAYVDDLNSDFEGMREGIRRVFAKSRLLGTFNEFTGFDLRSEAPDEETYMRRLHWGALQLVMDNSPSANTDPWRSSYTPALMESYRDYSWLHLELIPYLHSYDWAMYESGEPVMRSPDPENFRVLLGNEIFVAYVVEPGVRTLPIELPPGEWIDRWDESRVLSGTVLQPVPLGREPMFFRNGAIVPLDVRRDYLGHGTTASEGSLTVLVYPKGVSSFRYRDDELARWIQLQSTHTKDGLLLEASARPSKPVIWRVARWPSRPSNVHISGTQVLVWTAGGLSNIREAASEEDAEGSTTNAWYYDAERRALIIKAVIP